MCLRPPTLPRFLQASGALPALPEVAHQLLALFGREDLALAELVDLIASDTALAIRLLRLANSARYRPLTRVTRLQDAAAIIGLAPLRSMALGACLAQAFPRPAGFDRLRFWRQNLATAGYARWLAAHLGLDGDRAEVAGLLLRSGELLMLLVEPDLTALVQAQAILPDSVFDLQRHHLGCTHAELSAELAVHWRLPTAIVDALFTAGDPLAWQPFSADGALLRVASLLADAAGRDPLAALQRHQPLLASGLRLDLAALARRLPDFAGLTANATDLLH